MAKCVVIENTPGCLPESEPAEFDTWGEGREYAQSLAEDLRESGYRVHGNKRDGYYAERGANDIGRVIEILPADE